MPNLVGIGLSQVPTNSMLGGLAYQDPEHASIKDLDLKNLSQINSEISGTAYDTFVYDTRKDSDGGAWRKRTQYTSWYNTTDYENDYIKRGSRKDFPAIAVLVASNNGLDIYDGDDPDLPLWVRFKTNSRSPIYVAPNPGALAALNGIVFVGADNGGSGSYTSEFGFIHDKMRLHQDGGKNQTRETWVTGMVQKSDGSSWISEASPISISNDHQLVDRKTNDIAMTVLSNAPIDEVSGLPRPTIAVGTDGGPSIIKDDGTVVDLTYQESSNRIVRMIDIDSNGRIYWSTRETGSAPGIYFHEADLPAADSSAEPPVNISTNQAGAANAVKPTLISGSLRDVIRTKDRTVLSLSGSDSKGHLNLYNVTGDVNSSGSVDNFEMVDISTDYNTGYIIGDIKGVFLSDTDTTNAVGTELHPNGNSNFSSTDVSYINNTASGTATVTSNQLVLSGGTAGYSDHIITVNTEVGAKYVISIDYVSNSGYNGSIGMYVNSAYLNELNDNSGYIARSTGNTYTWYFTADQTTENLDLVTAGAASNTYTFDNWTIKKVEEDRSVNNNGLQVFGTVTKQPVATGAELVSYSGFGNSNYLEQPYNTDLNFGTGDFSLMNWIYVTAGGDYQVVFDRWTPGGGNARFYYGLQTDEKIYFHHREDNSANATDLTGSTVLTAGVWHHMAAVRRGSNVEVYLNGKLDNSTTSTIRNVTPGSTQPILRIGTNAVTSPSDPMLSKLALLRISGSAPSPEQVKKMYEDEKHLFQENAACTLYGSPSNVTAIAYDDSTNILYAGTAAGRSEFQGLRRINNTTTAVTTAISASNGLVAEQ